MSADILKAHRKTRLSGKEEGLVAYYPFEKKQLDSYNQVVTIGNAEDLTGSDEFAIPLTISLAVKGNVPEWKVETGKYESTMSMIGTLSILGKPSNDADDIVGVFIDGECRGVAQPVYNERYDNYFVMMDIYGDDVDTNKPLVFQAYDSSTGIMYPQVSTSEEVSFCANRLIGKYAQPLLLEAADIIEQALVLNKGWNWTSLYVQPEDMQVSSIFASVAKNLELVKNKSHFASFDKGQAYGNTFELYNKSMYKVRMSDAQALKLIGKRPTLEDRKITVEPEWNWIAYNSTFTTPIADAFAG